MTGLIPQAFIDEIVARTDVVEVVGSRISLKKAGREYKAVCPFHDEKTPSFTVSTHKGFYHCFGCGAHGTAITFLMNYEGLGFVDAVEALAEVHGLEIPAADQDARDSSRENTLYETLSDAHQLYRENLRQYPMAIEYLKKRGLDGKTAGLFGIGFAPNAWDTVLKHLGGNDKKIKNLIDTGLITKNEKGQQYDRFRNRIMFPIHDPRGRVIGFGGRLIESGEPKYLNSPETTLFNKGKTLYGIYEARQAYQKKPSLGSNTPIIVVEGYLDVASLTQHGVGPSVATLGTATTSDHVRQLARLANSVVFCFDGDRAGKAAAWKAMEAILPHAGNKIDIKFLLLPEGEDPDSLVMKHGKNAFIELMHKAFSLSEFLISQLMGRINISNADGKSRLAAEIRPLLNKIPAGVYQELLLTQLSEQVGLSKERLEKLLIKTPKDKPGLSKGIKSNQASASHSNAEQRNPLIRKAIELILHYPSSGIEPEKIAGLSKVNQPGADLLRQLLDTTANNKEITTAGLLERFRNDREGKHLGLLLTTQPLDNSKVAPQVLRDSLKRIVQNYQKERLRILLEKAESLEPQEQIELESLLRHTPKTNT